MSQTTPGPSKSQRLGQRQREREQRQQRQRRQHLQQFSLVGILGVLVLGVIIFLVWRNAQSSQNAAPTSGPNSPPQVNGKEVPLPGGLKYIDIKQGNGAEAKNGSNISVQYTGWLQSNGHKFDSSYDHGGQPFTLTIGQHQVIPGWEQGLIGIKAGGERRLIIPPALGYGSAQQQGIPANSTLIFDVKAESIQ